MYPPHILTGYEPRSNPATLINMASNLITFGISRLNSEEDYPVWKQRMIAALQFNDLADTVLEPTPAPTDKKGEAYKN